MSSVKTILGNRLFAGLLNHYLARTGYQSRQTNEPEDPDRASNLYAPAAGGYGAHGRFDDRARDFSAQLWTDLHRDWLIGFVLAGVAALSAAVLRSKVKMLPRYGNGDSFPGC